MTRVHIVHKVGALDPRSFYKEGRSLKRAGYDVTVCLLGSGETIVDGIRVLGFPKGGSRLVRFAGTNLKLFLHLWREKPDICHIHDLDFLPWAVLLKVLRKVRVIYDIHEAYPEYMLLKSYIPKPLRRLASVGVRILEQTSIRFFDAIVPNDNFIAATFKHRRNVTIFNFPTRDFFAGSVDTDWKEREYDLFYHGSLPTYHIERMMNIAEQLLRYGLSTRWGLVTNDQATINWANEQLRQRNLTEQFQFLPYTDYLKVAGYLNKARIGIIPLPPYAKFMKNIPLKMFEFMGCGLPMVLSDLPPSRQFIEGQNCAIAVEPDDTQQYAEAIRTLLEDPERAIGMGRVGQKLVRERYSWEAQEKMLAELYEDLFRAGRTEA